MMQRKLYDPSDAAKIWRKSTLPGDSVEEDECPDLLELSGEPEVLGDQKTSKLDDFDEDGVDGFEDLLSTDDDDLLEYTEERERLSVERETEEMLLGSGWAEDARDEDDVFLLEGDDGVDPMLL